MSAKEKDFPLAKLVEQFKSRKDVYNVFGVILYTEQDPYVIRILRDDDFWKSLHTASGPRWPIFSIRPRSGQNTPTSQEELGEGFQMLVPIYQWHEPAENQQLLEIFGINDTKALPMLLVFAEGPKREILQVAFKLAGENADSCYASLKGAIDVAAKAVEEVREENIKNTYEIFNLMEGALIQHIWFRRINPFVELVEKIRGLF